MRRTFAVLFLLAASTPRAADACGGFFCSQSPVLQTAERVVLTVEDGRTVAYVELEYQGSDPGFAWIIPVPSPPTVEVGVGRAMFAALDSATRPRFVGGAVASNAQASIGAGCEGDVFDSPSFDPGSVRVLERARVGPYEHVVLDADTAKDLDAWLQVNGYRVSSAAEPIVAGYLAEGMKLLALKLAPDASASAIEPIKLTYSERDACMIPVKLTRIAAVPHLQIVAWVLGDARAVPVSYAETTVDARELLSSADWIPAVGRAVDAAGGHAFVVELAGKTSELDDGGDPALAELFRRHAWVTRFRTELDPDEMTQDPRFELDPLGEPVSNVVVLGGGSVASAGIAVSVLGLFVAVRARLLNRSRVLRRRDLEGEGGEERA